MGVKPLDFTVNVNDLTGGVSKQGFGLILALDTKHDIPYTLISKPSDLIVEDVSNKTIEELKEYVFRNKLKVDTDLNKDELISAIKEEQGGLATAGITQESRIYKLTEKLFMQKPSPQQVAVYGEQASIKGALDNLMNDMNNDWFSLVCTNNEDGTIEKLSKWATANNKIYYVTTQNVKVVNGLNYRNSFVIYHHDPEEFLAEGLAAYMAVRNPGSSVPKHKSIEGSNVAKVSATDYAELEKNHGGTYLREKGINHITSSRTTSGAFLDTVLGGYFIKFRAEESIFQLATTKEKITYDNKDIAELAGRVRSVLNTAASDDYKIILTNEAKEPQYDMTVMRREEMPANEIANRNYDGIHVKTQVAGAIETGTVNIDFVL